jgi:hypothetical protein
VKKFTAIPSTHAIINDSNNNRRESQQESAKNRKVVFDRCEHQIAVTAHSTDGDRREGAVSWKNGSNDEISRYIKVGPNSSRPFHGHLHAVRELSVRHGVQGPQSAGASRRRLVELNACSSPPQCNRRLLRAVIELAGNRRCGKTGEQRLR